MEDSSFLERQFERAKHDLALFTTDPIMQNLSDRDYPYSTARSGNDPFADPDEFFVAITPYKDVFADALAWLSEAPTITPGTTGSGSFIGRGSTLRSKLQWWSKLMGSTAWQNVWRDTSQQPLDTLREEWQLAKREAERERALFRMSDPVWTGIMALYTPFTSQQGGRQGPLQKCYNEVYAQLDQSYRQTHGGRALSGQDALQAWDEAQRVCNAQVQGVLNFVRMCIGEDRFERLPKCEGALTYDDLLKIDPIAKAGFRYRFTMDTRVPRGSQVLSRRRNWIDHADALGYLIEQLHALYQQRRAARPDLADLVASLIAGLHHERQRVFFWISNEELPLPLKPDALLTAHERNRREAGELVT